MQDSCLQRRTGEVGSSIHLMATVNYEPETQKLDAAIAVLFYSAPFSQANS